MVLSLSCWLLLIITTTITSLPLSKWKKSPLITLTLPTGDKKSNPLQEYHPTIITRFELRQCMIQQSYPLNENNNISFLANVPGSLTLDYCTSMGIEPYADNSEIKLSWISTQSEWTYVVDYFPQVITQGLCMNEIIQDKEEDCTCQIYFESLDTIADIFANNVYVGSSNNAYLPLAINVPCNLQQLRIRFSSSLLTARKTQNGNQYPHTVNYNTWTEISHRNMIRKPAADFGWDWGPAFPGPGIVGRTWLYKGMPSSLYFDHFIFSHSRILNPINPGMVKLDMKILFRSLLDLDGKLKKLLGDNKWSITVSIQDPTTNNKIIPDILGRVEISDTITEIASYVTCTIENPQLWWPVNSFYSHQSSSPIEQKKPFLYNVIITIFYTGMSTQIVRKRIGIRTVNLLQWKLPNYQQHHANDGDNHTFAEQPEFKFEINSQYVYLRGLNYVPPDAFYSTTNHIQQQQKRELNDLIRHLLLSSIAMGSNVIRVWGGGPIPSDDFYDAADEYGLLIWQDLPYACAVFPPHRQDVEVETREIIYKLQHHASIIVWGGNNEVEASFTWFPQVIAKLQNYRQDYIKLFIETIEPIIQQADPSGRTYLDSSPSNGKTSSNPGAKKVWGDVNDPTRGDIHFYSYDTDCEDSNSYPKNALFVSEHGFLSISRILTRFISTSSIPPPNTPDVDDKNKEMFQKEVFRRLRHDNGFKQIENAARRRFGDIVGLNDMNYKSKSLLSQIIQARCMNMAIQTWKSSIVNNGIILWQLNDNWPGISWSMIEWDGSWKPSAYVLKRMFSPITVSGKWHVENNNDGLLQVEILVQDICRNNNNNDNNQLSNKCSPVQGVVIVEFFTFQQQQQQPLPPEPLRLLFQFDDSSPRQISLGRYSVVKSSLFGIRLLGTWTSYLDKGTLPEFFLEPYLQNGLVIDLAIRDQLVSNPIDLRVEVMNDASQIKCMIVLKASRGFAFHVWLEVIDPQFNGQGYFQDNFFHMIQGEEKKIEFIWIGQQQSPETFARGTRFDASSTKYQRMLLGDSWCSDKLFTVTTLNDLKLWTSNNNNNSSTNHTMLKL
jgi:hypothetical protein